MARVEIVRGDITEPDVDAVVNAANVALGAIPAFLGDDPGSVHHVRMVLFSERDRLTYERAAAQLSPPAAGGR